MADKLWTPLELIKTSADFLGKKGVPTPRLDAEILLTDILQCKRVDLYTRFDRTLTEEEINRYRDFIRRRSLREPVSRILGHREFMGISFSVTKDVLSPRPETELLVEEALRLLEAPKPKKRSDAVFVALEAALRKAASESGDVPDFSSSADVVEPVPTQNAPAPRKVLDLGTGSGCIAISIAAMCPHVQVVACDLSDAALLIARENAQQAQVWSRIDFRHGDLFNCCWEGEQFDLIVSNPPYLIPEDPEIWPEVRNYDPPMALYGGKDGLDFYRKIAAEAEIWLNPDGAILLEVGAGQAQAVQELFRQHTSLIDLTSLRDTAGYDRLVIARRAKVV